MIKRFLILLFSSFLLLYMLNQTAHASFNDFICSILPNVLRMSGISTYTINFSPLSSDRACADIDTNLFLGKFCISSKPHFTLILIKAHKTLTSSQEKSHKKGVKGASNVELQLESALRETIDETHYIFQKAGEAVAECVLSIPKSDLAAIGHNEFTVFAISFDALLQQILSNRTFAQTFFAKAKTEKKAIKKEQTRQIRILTNNLLDYVVNVILPIVSNNARYEQTDANIQCSNKTHSENNNCCVITTKNFECDLCIYNTIKQNKTIEFSTTIEVNRILVKDKTIRNKIKEETWEILVHAVFAYLVLPVINDVLGKSIIEFNPSHLLQLQLEVFTDVFDAFLQKAKSDPYILKELTKL